MAQKTVNFNSKSYIVENGIGEEACITLDLTGGASKVASYEYISLRRDASKDPNSQGVAESIVNIVSIDELGESSKKKHFKGTFDETKINVTGFGNLLKRTIINAIFSELLGIEPLNMDGTVKPEFQ